MQENIFEKVSYDGNGKWENLAQKTIVLRHTGLCISAIDDPNCISFSSRTISNSKVKNCILQSTLFYIILLLLMHNYHIKK